MKSHIQTVLEMHKAGTISDEQAAELLAELSKGQGATPKSAHMQEGFIRPFVDLISNTVSSVVEAHGAHSSSLQGIFQSDLHDNQIHMSRCDSPNGSDYTFQKNAVRMSSVTGLLLQKSEMQANQIDASHVEDIRLQEAKWNGNRIQASKVEHLTAARSEVQGLQILSSACKRIAVDGESTVHETKINASSIKDWTLTEGSRLENS
ncbi:hypothetical protein K2X33_06135, partial [bacterium]|nr:hypothetical protein [bacterium]